MNPIRNNQIYVSEKTMFYARILAKAKTNGTNNGMTVDQIIDAELTDKWEKEFPQLQAAYEKNCELKQKNRKEYAEAEAEAIRLIAPVPGGRQTPVATERKE